MMTRSVSKLHRRQFLHLTALGAAGASLGAHGAAAAADDPKRRRTFGAPFENLEEVTVSELQRAMDDGRLTSRRLTRSYILRIQALDRRGPELRSVLQINPDALDIAEELDRERRAQGPRGSLHGIPVLLKDNIGTADRMETTAGSLALLGFPPARDATVAAKLREAGAVLLGKTNLSEWANFRDFPQSSSGWSARGGQSKNPFALDHNPSGSSSGVPVSANLCAVSVGTETDGSIVSPASACGVVGIKPTVGLTSRFNVIPISDTQDTIGPLTRTVADAAAVLSAISGPDPLDPKTDGSVQQDFTQFVDPNGLVGARIGVARDLFNVNPEADGIANAAVQAMADAGATMVDVELGPAGDGGAELEVLLFEFKDGIRRYLERLAPGSPKTLQDLIDFNIAHAEEELKFFGQAIFEQSNAKAGIPNPDYLAALAASQPPAQEAINSVLDAHGLDALVFPTRKPAVVTDLVNGDGPSNGRSGPAARAGFPLVTVPAGFVFGLPVNVNFMGRAFSEPTLIRLASGFEAVTQVRRAPDFPPTADLDS